MKHIGILGRNLHPHQVRLISPLPPAIPYWEPPEFVEVHECISVFDDKLHDILSPARMHICKGSLDGQMSLFGGEL